MSVETVLINGPAGTGKTSIARLLAERVFDRPAHYLRLVPAADAHTNSVEPLPAGTVPAPRGVAWLSVHQVSYTSDRVFETLPESLRAVRREDRERRAFMIIEAGTDPALRHAYPYDYRLFVMSAPPKLHTVFREPKAAAAALKQVMQDTAAFASEIFGLFEGAGMDDSVGVLYERSAGGDDREATEEHLEVREAQLRQFLNSPLGAEIASRIQLQPDYHAIVEADVVIINTGIGDTTDEMDECIHRIEKLLARIRHDARRHSVLYWGDITDMDDPSSRKLLKRLRTLFSL